AFGMPAPGSCRTKQAAWGRTISTSGGGVITGGGLPLADSAVSELEHAAGSSAASAITPTHHRARARRSFIPPHHVPTGLQHEGCTIISQAVRLQDHISIAVRRWRTA